MYFLLSGEGPTDLGECGNLQRFAQGADFTLGPMAVLLDHLVEQHLGYAHIRDGGAVGYLSEAGLSDYATVRKSAGFKLRIPRIDAGRGTGFFFWNAFFLAHYASNRLEPERVVAVLFRDADKSNSTPRDVWQRKWDSIMDGFKRAGLDRGVPMLPRPKSEAWLLCIARGPAPHGCADLEDTPGNDGSPHSLKRQLRETLGYDYDCTELVDLVESAPAADLDMPSFAAFRQRLEAAIDAVPR